MEELEEVVVVGVVLVVVAGAIGTVDALFVVVDDGVVLAVDVERGAAVVEVEIG